MEATAAMGQEPFLPPEVWSLVIENIQDYCFAWFVLRRVSSSLRQVTEDVFARYVFHTCSITFYDSHIRELLLGIWSSGAISNQDEPGPFPHGARHPASWNMCFQPFAFSPDVTKERVILQPRYDTEKTSYSARNAGEFLEAVYQAEAGPDSRKFSLRVQRSTSPTQIGPADGVTLRSHNKLLWPIISEMFTVEAVRRLLRCSHFVALNGTCKLAPSRCVSTGVNDFTFTSTSAKLSKDLECYCQLTIITLVKSIRIPSIAINHQTQVISVDWRLLCQGFYFDELRRRRAEKPWLRHVRVDDCSSVVKIYTVRRDDFLGYHLPEEARGNGWLFWDQLPTGEYGFLQPRQVKQENRP